MICATWSAVRDRLVRVSADHIFYRISDGGVTFYVGVSKPYGANEGASARIRHKQHRMRAFLDYFAPRSDIWHVTFYTAQDVADLLKKHHDTTQGLYQNLDEYAKKASMPVEGYTSWEERSSWGWLEQLLMDHFQPYLNKINNFQHNPLPEAYPIPAGMSRYYHLYRYYEVGKPGVVQSNTFRLFKGLGKV